MASIFNPNPHTSMLVKITIKPDNELTFSQQIQPKESKQVHNDGRGLQLSQNIHK